MKVSLNTVKQFTNIDITIDELKDKINSQLGTIESIVDLSDKYKDAIVVKIVRVSKHPDADRLNVCLVDDGGAFEDAPRNDDGLVQIVCGAPNVREGMYAVWLPPRSVVPATYEDETPFVLGARELRGVLSQGMLAAGDELAVNSDHDGIVELTEYDMPEDMELNAGQRFAEIFGLNDTIFDIENKMFTHRPDLFGQLGVARELFAITRTELSQTENTDIRFGEPEWYASRQPFDDASGLELNVFNKAKEKIPRFMTVAMKDVTIKPSPMWLQTTLVRWGSKPINNVVDVTNYIMLLTAQPTHAYDYDKLRGATIGARLAAKGESVRLLNDKTYELDESDIVIADGEGPIGLAGIMGGGDSEVSNETRNIVLEVANFDMYTLRKSSMRHGIFTDALTRFNKGQSPLQNDRVLAKLINLMHGLAGASQASDVSDLHAFDPNKDMTTLHGSMNVSVRFINQRLGLELSPESIGNLLRRVNFAVYKPGEDEDELSVTAPFWRTDIEIQEDIVEEVGRIYGYDNLPRELPKRFIAPVAHNPIRSLNQTVRNALAQAGANEVLTYSFVHENILKRAGQSPEQAFRISNALSPDLQYYRLSLTPSLLDKVHGNIKSGYDEFALFEIGKAHSKIARLDDAEHVPPEMRRIALTYASKKVRAGAAYYHVKSLLEHLLCELNIKVAYEPLGEASRLAFSSPFDEVRSARVVDAKSGQSLGVLGEYKPSVANAFKLPPYAAGFELLPEAIEFAVNGNDESSYSPLSRFPSVKRDVSFKVPNDVTYQQLVDFVLSTPSPFNQSIEFEGIYQGEDKETRNITLRLAFTSHERTLSSDDANIQVDAISKTVNEATGATVV